MANEEDREAALNAGLNQDTPPADAPADPPADQPDNQSDQPPADAADAAADHQDDQQADEQEDRQPTRAERRIQALAEAKARAEAEAQVAREAAERYRREAEAASADRRRQEDELLDPTERRMRDLERSSRDAQMAAFDAGDRAAFYSQAAIDPTRAKYKERVEAELQKARASGQVASREGIYVYLRGQDAIAAEAKSAAARKKSVDGVRAERGRPSTPRSDAAPRRASTPEERLKDVPI